MEYLAGSLVTVVLIFVARKFYEISKPNKTKINLTFRQSKIFELTKPSINFYVNKRLGATQATKHFDRGRIRIVMTESKAYWIKDNAVYEADVFDGIVQENSTKVVDMMALDDVKLKDMMFIIDKLTEGQTNDSGDSWNS